jgi:hypothetical protein
VSRDADDNLAEMAVGAHQRQRLGDINKPERLVDWQL